VISYTHRIIAIFLIVESFRENSKVNPFSMNLIEIFEKSDSFYEKKFIYNCFVKSNKEVKPLSHLNKTFIKNLQNEIEMTDSFRIPDDYQSFKKMIIENMPHV
jgi:hypothetical protein